MGRPFVVEFDDFNTNKFYVCRVCGTPLARNTDVVHYKMRASDELEGEFVWLSCLKTLSNVDFSDLKQEIASSNLYIVGRQICCIFCSNKVGFKLVYHSHIYPGSHNVDALISDRTLFRINSENLDHRTVSPEEWFNLPQPCADEQ